MSKNITYLLGAGASANALPLIKYKQSVDETDPVFDKVSNKGILKGLPLELLKFANEYMGQFNRINSGKGESYKVKQLSDIAQQCINFGTPDLYAKYLLETGDDDNYQLLKMLISCYFDWTENSDSIGNALGHGAFDQRALSFLSTISNDRKLPKNIKIISWNYDTQIEKAARLLRLKSSSINDSISGFSSWPNININDKTEEYFMVHINGIAGFDYSAENLASRKENPLEINPQKEPLLSFAWENENNTSKKTFIDKRMELVSNIVDGTNILVVIGYTFPFFNRIIDKAIFKKMNGSLKKIYFQDPNLNGEFLYDQFDLPKKDGIVAAGITPIIKIPIIHIENVEQYYVPYEL